MPQKTNWKDHYQLWKNSKLTKADYCRKNNLNIQTFYTFTTKFKNDFIEIPFTYTGKNIDRNQYFEISFAIPFSFRLKIDLHFGRNI